MSNRLAIVFFLLMVCAVSCDSPEDVEVVEDEDYQLEERGFSDYDSWKPPGQSAAPDVILIKQKEPGLFTGTSISSLIKDNLPLLAVLAPLVAVAVMLPLKSYLGPAYYIFPPAAPAPATTTASRSKEGGTERGLSNEHGLAGQILTLIEDMDKAYGELAGREKRS